MLKNNRAKKFLVFFLAFLTVASSYPTPTANAAAGDIILLWDGTEASIPSGWTCISCAGQEFNGKFPRIVTSSPGTNGGADTVSHTFNFSSAGSGAGTPILPAGISNALPTDAHTHTWPATRTAASTDIRPPYQNLLFIKKSNPVTLPAGVIGMFETSSLPAGWTSYGALNTNNTFLRGDADTATGGGVTHTHIMAATADSGGAAGTANSVASVTVVAGAAHTHTVGATATTDTNNNTPSSITIIFAKLGGSGEQDLADGLIAFADHATVPIGWSIMTSLGGTSLSTPRLLKGSATTAGTIAGSDTHTHANVVQTSGTPSATGNTTVGVLGNLASDTHTHSLTWSISASGSALPSYREIMLTKLRLIEVSGSVYTDEGSSKISGTPTIKFAFTSSGSQGAKTATVSGGDYSIKIPDPGAGRQIHAWLSGAAQKAVTVTRSDGVATSITGFDLYQDRLILRHEDAGPITNADAGVCDNASGTACTDPDLFFNEAGSVLTADSGVRIFVWTGDTFTPGGNVSSPEIKINTSGILSAGSNTLTLTGNGTPFIVLGTFTPGTSTVTYAPAGTTGVTVATSGITYHHIIFNKAGNTFSLAGSLTTHQDGDLTITAGTLDTTINNFAIVVGGNWTNNGTFTANGSNVNFTSTSTGKTLAGAMTGTSAFSAVTFNGLGGGWSNSSTMLVTGHLTMTAGTFSGTNDVEVRNNVSGTAGVINKTGGTFTQKATSGNRPFGATTAGTNWTFASLTFDNDGTPRTITTNSGTGTITVTSVLTITASTTLDAGDRTWILSGSGTPAVISGTITPSTSTFRFSGSSATSIRAADYYNLQVFPGGASVTHTLGTASGQTFTIANNLDLGGNSNSTGTVITAATHNPAISVAGNLTLCAATCSNQMTFTKGTGTLTLKPTGTKTWTDNNTTKQDVGVVSISGGASSPQINLGSSVMAESVNVAASHTLNANGANTLTLKGNGTPFVVTGTFTSSTGTVTYAPTNTSGVNVTNVTYNHVIFNRAGNVFSLVSGGITTKTGGDLTITDGTLDTISGSNFPISVGGSWTNNDAFLANAGTVTFTSTSGGRTLAGTMTGTSSFNNLTFNGNSGGWTLSNDVRVTSILNIALGTLNASSRTITLTANGTPFVVTGGFTPSTSTVTYAPTSASNVTVASTTYHHVIFNKASNFFLLTTGGITTQDEGNLTITAGTLDTISGSNFPISVGGSWTNNDAFIANSGTVTFTSPTTGKTLAGNMTGANAFNNLTFNRSGGGWSFSGTATLNGDMVVQAGTLSGTNSVTIGGGDLTCLITCGEISFTGGTTTLKGTGNLGTAGLSPSWTFSSLTFGDGAASTTTTAEGGGTVTITSTLTVSSNHTLSAGAKTYQLTANGTPFVVTGTFTPATSTVTYAPTGTSGVTVASTTYHHIIFNKASNTFSLTTGGITTQNGGNLTITAGTLDTVSGQNYPIYVGGNWTNNGTFTARNGTVTFTATSTGKTINMGGSNFYNIAFNGSGGGWSFSGATLTVNSLNIIAGTLTGVSGTTTVTGDWGNTGIYIHNNGTVLFTNAAVTSNITGSTTFYKFDATVEGKTLKFSSGGPPGNITEIVNDFKVGKQSGGTCAIPVFLRSADNGVQWHIRVQTAATVSVIYTDVKDSQARTDGGKVIVTTETNDEGGNTNWTIPGCLPKITTTPASPIGVKVFDWVVITGSDFSAGALGTGSTAEITWDGNAQTFTIPTDERGAFGNAADEYTKYNFQIPRDYAGAHNIAAKDTYTLRSSTNKVFTISPLIKVSETAHYTSREIKISGWGFGICDVDKTIADILWSTTDIGDADLECPEDGGETTFEVSSWKEVGDF